MPFGTLETLASIVIILSVIKLIVFLISRGSWFNFTKKVYSKPLITSIIALILAAIVLYYLINAGITIVDIFAVMLFLGMIMIVAVSRYINELVNWISKKDPKSLLKEQWFFMLIWIILLIWVIVAIWFS